MHSPLYWATCFSHVECPVIRVKLDIHRTFSCITKLTSREVIRAYLLAGIRDEPTMCVSGSGA